MKKRGTEFLKTCAFPFALPFLPILLCGISVQSSKPFAVLLRLREFLLACYLYAAIVAAEWAGVKHWAISATQLILGIIFFRAAFEYFINCMRFSLPEISKERSSAHYRKISTDIKQAWKESNTDYARKVNVVLANRGTELIRDFSALWDDVNVYSRPLRCAFNFILFALAAIFAFSLLYSVLRPHFILAQNIGQPGLLDLFVYSLHIMTMGEGSFYPGTLPMKTLVSVQYLCGFASISLFLPLILSASTQKLRISAAISELFAVIFSKDAVWTTLITEILFIPTIVVQKDFREEPEKKDSLDA